MENATGHNNWKQMLQSQAFAERVANILYPNQGFYACSLAASREKYATNIAGYIALVQAIECLCIPGEKPLEGWLQQVAANDLLPKERNLLLHAANTTWKAGQPFRGMDRITRPVFLPHSQLPPQEQEKDLVQVKTAATLALKLLQQEKLLQKHFTTEYQKTYMKSESFLVQLAEGLNNAYYLEQGLRIPAEASDKKPVTIAAETVRIGMALSFFYALEGWLDLFTEHEKEKERDLLNRFSKKELSSSEENPLFHLTHAARLAADAFLDGVNGGASLFALPEKERVLYYKMQLDKLGRLVMHQIHS